MAPFTDVIPRGAGAQVDVSVHLNASRSQLLQKLYHGEEGNAVRIWAALNDLFEQSAKCATELAGFAEHPHMTSCTCDGKQNVSEIPAL